MSDKKFIIDKLTPEKEATIPAHVDKWIKIGLSTEPARRGDAEAALKRAYMMAEYTSPSKFVWVDNPMDGCILSYILESLNENEEGISNFKSYDGEYSYLYKKLIDTLDMNYHEHVSKLFNGLDENMNSVRSHIYKCGYGQFDASWLAFYEFFMGIKPELDKIISKLEPLMQHAKAAGAWWPYPDICIMCPRPSSIYRDDQGRLHAETAPALMYDDRFKIYAWGGTRVDEWIIEQPHLITPDKVLKENNQEIRRIMLNKFGWDKFMKVLGAKEIQRDDTGVLLETEKLGEYLDGEDSIARFAMVTCPSTGRKYALRGDPRAKTARELVASTWGLKPNIFKPSQHT